MTPVAFPWAFKAFHHFPPAYFPGFKYSKAFISIHSRLFHHVIQTSFSPNAKFQKPGNCLSFLGHAMLFHILEAFLKFVSELPQTPSFPSLSCPHGHSAQLLVSPQQLFNMAFLYPTKSCLTENCSCSSRNSSLGPFLQRLPQVLLPILVYKG